MAKKKTRRALEHHDQPRPTGTYEETVIGGTHVLELGRGSPAPVDQRIVAAGLVDAALRGRKAG